MIIKLKQWAFGLVVFGFGYISLGADIPDSLLPPKVVNKHMENEVLPNLSPKQRKPAKEFWGKVWSQYTTSNSFYGKVLEVDGRPVAKAKIKLTALDDSNEGYTEYATVTDSRGVFEFNFKGKSAQIEVRHPDYYISKMNPYGFEFGDEADEEYYVPDSHKPVVFRAFRKGVSEPLIQGKDEWELDQKGDPVYLDLLRKSEVKLPESYSQVDLIVKFFKPAAKSGEKSDWTLDLEVPGGIGGLILTRDEFMFRAPQEGYIKSTSLKRKDFKEGSVDGIYVYLYLCSREGTIRGRLRLSLGSQRGKRIDPKTGELERVSFMRLNYFINPKGSSNLEYEYGNTVGIKFISSNEIKLIYPDPEKLKEVRREFSGRKNRDLNDGTGSSFDFFPE